MKDCRRKQLQKTLRLRSFFFRYLRAATDGAARLKFRLLAKAIAGKLHAGNLVADEFLLYADSFANLKTDMRAYDFEQIV